MIFCFQKFSVFCYHFYSLIDDVKFQINLIDFSRGIFVIVPVERNHFPPNKKKNINSF